MTEDWNREKSLLLDRITELEDQGKSGKSCQTCLHHDVCQRAEQMTGNWWWEPENFNQFSKDIREFLGDKCPHYREEETEDEE